MPDAEGKVLRAINRTRLSRRSFAGGCHPRQRRTSNLWINRRVWWWSLSLCRTFLNNACGLVRKRTESCGLITLRKHLMKPAAKTPLALLQ